MNQAVETRRFEAEVQQVLHLVVHSLYSHKEIFLRELISNASDACDKLRFEAIANPELGKEGSDLAIDVSWDRDAGTLSVSDNGIGMSHEEVIDHLGTIARSGTKRFLEALSGDARKDTQLIGQFGVGFYSAFIVADRVTVETRRADAAASDGVRWESDGTDSYQIQQIERAGRGTTVTLHLKDDEREFLDGWRLRGLIHKYSEHIAFPIRLPAEKDGKPTGELEVVNQAKALWTRPRNELSDDDYQAFYKQLSGDFRDPLAWSHNRVEGTQSYTTLVFLPAQPPFDAMFSNREERQGLKLYIRRVFVLDAAEQLLPAYLRFVRGVVDSDDLPLNVSRELLQENKLVAQIRGGIVKRVLDVLEKLVADKPEDYATFWKSFGNTLKEGIAEDTANRQRIAKLLRFASTAQADGAQSTSLDDYIARMREGQDAIYYLTADGYAAASGSPQLESLKSRGIEVLLLHDRIDEWMTGYLHEYSGKSLRNIAKGELDLGALADSADAAKDADAGEASKALTGRLKSLLGDRVSDVRVSRRLTESPACVVTAEHDMALHMQRLLREAGHDLPSSANVLEINPSHPLLVAFSETEDDTRAGDLAAVLLDQGIIAGGGVLEDPADFVRRLNRLLVPTT